MFARKCKEKQTNEKKFNTSRLRWCEKLAERTTTSEKKTQKLNPMVQAARSEFYN